MFRPFRTSWTMLVLNPAPYTSNSLPWIQRDRGVLRQINFGHNL